MHATFSFFFCPSLNTSAKYFSLKGFILLFFIHHVLLTSLSYISLLLRKPYINLTVGVQAGLGIFFSSHQEACDNLSGTTSTLVVTHQRARLPAFSPGMRRKQQAGRCQERMVLCLKAHD